MSSTSQKKPPIVTTPRLITVGRGRVPIRRDLHVPQPGVERERGLASSQSEPPVNLRRPNVLGHLASRSGGPDDVLGEEKAAKKRHEEEMRMMREEFAKLKTENEKNMNALQMKVMNLEREKEKDMEIKRLQQELLISQRLLKIQSRKQEAGSGCPKEKQPDLSDPLVSQGKVAPQIDPVPETETQSWFQPCSTADMSDPTYLLSTAPTSATAVYRPPVPPQQLPLLNCPDQSALEPQKAFSFPRQFPTSEPVPPLFLPQRTPEFPQFTPPAPLESFQFPPPPPLESSQFPPPRPRDCSRLSPQLFGVSGAESSPGISASRYQDYNNSSAFNNKQVDVDGFVCEYSHIEEQEKILRQIEEENLKKTREEVKSMELIQQLGWGGWSRPESVSNSNTAADDDQWTKVTKAVRGSLAAANQKQEEARRQQEELEKKKWEEWRLRMRENEEKEKARILKCHEESQKLRVIKADITTEVLPSKAHGSSSMTSLPNRSGQTQGARTARGKSAEMSSFEIERRKAVAELKQRMEVQEKDRRSRMRQERLAQEWELARARKEKAGGTSAATKGKKKP